MYTIVSIQSIPIDMGWALRSVAEKFMNWKDVKIGVRFFDHFKEI